MSEARHPVRLAILGAGHIGRRHAACAQQVSEATVTAVWSRTPSSAARLGHDIGARTLANLSELHDADDVDAVIVCTPSAYHVEPALAGLQAGKHVICEKPLARTLEQADQIRAAAEEAGLGLYVAHVVRFFPSFRQLHDQVVAGTVGQPAVIRMSRATDKAPTGWRAELALSGGALLEMGVHDLDWLLWTCGPAERVFCRSMHRGNYTAPDYALTTVRLRSGAIAHVESSMAKTKGFRVHGEIAGDRGLLSYDSDDDTALRLEPLDSTGLPGIHIPTTYTIESPYVSQLRHFCRCIRDSEAPLVTPDQAREALRVSLAALESAGTNRPVSL